MLIQFRVENFLSIKDSVVLSLLASKDNEHSEHLIVNGSKRYLKSAVIYGANASGKSNVLHAFWFMVNYVLTSHNQQLHKSIERSPFKFDRETPSRPSSFEVIFTTNGIRYAYGFSVTDKAVIEEYLYYYPNGRQAIIFERQNTNDFRFTVDVDEQSMLKNRTSPNKLYLSVASNWNYSKVIPVLEWFASCLIITKISAADTLNAFDYDGVAEIYNNPAVDASTFEASGEIIETYGTFESYGNVSYVADKTDDGIEFVRVIQIANYEKGKLTFTASFFEDGSVAGFRLAD